MVMFTIIQIIPIILIPITIIIILPINPDNPPNNPNNPNPNPNPPNNNPNNPPNNPNNHQILRHYLQPQVQVQVQVMPIKIIYMRPAPAICQQMAYLRSLSRLPLGVFNIHHHYPQFLRSPMVWPQTAHPQEQPQQQHQHVKFQKHLVFENPGECCSWTCNLRPDSNTPLCL